MPDVITEAVGSEPTYQMAVDQMAVEEYANLWAYFESHIGVLFTSEEATRRLSVDTDTKLEFGSIWLNYSVTQLLSFFLDPYTLEFYYKLIVYFLYYIFIYINI